MYIHISISLVSKNFYVVVFDVGLGYDPFLFHRYIISVDLKVESFLSIILERKLSTSKSHQIFSPPIDGPSSFKYTISLLLYIYYINVCLGHLLVNLIPANAGGWKISFA